MDIEPSKRRVPNFRLHTDKPGRIVEAALPVAIATRFDKMRVADVAGALGLSKSAIFHHFPTKLALWQAVIATYCLPETESGRTDLAAQLSAGDARQILAVVVREAHAVPGLGLFYRNCLVAGVSQWMTDGEEAAAAQVDAVLKALLFQHLFAASDGRE